MFRRSLYLLTVGLLVLTVAGVRADITALSTEMDGSCGSFTASGGLNQDFDTEKGRLTLAPTVSSQCWRVELPELSLADYPPPWQMEVRLHRPGTDDSSAMGIIAEVFSGDTSLGWWQTTAVYIRQADRHLINTVGNFANRPDWSVPAELAGANPICLAMRVLSDRKTQVGVKARQEDDWTWMPISLHAETITSLRTIGAFLEERQGLWDQWPGLGAKAPAAPRTYGIDYIRFSKIEQ